MEKLYFNQDELRTINNTLKQQIESLKSTLDEVKEKIDSIETVWEGTAGEATSKKLKELYNFFEILKENGDAYTNFLNEAISRYEEADTIQ